MIETSPVSSPLKFPLAYEAVNSCVGLIVLFTDEKRGIVIREANGDPYNKFGKYTDSWQPCSNTDHWKPVNVTISHK